MTCDVCGRPVPANPPDGPTGCYVCHATLCDACTEEIDGAFLCPRCAPRFRRTGRVPQRRPGAGRRLVASPSSADVLERRERVKTEMAAAVGIPESLFDSEP